MRRFTMGLAAAVWLAGCGAGRPQGTGEGAEGPTAPGAVAPGVQVGGAPHDASDAGAEDAGTDGGPSDAGVPAPIASYEVLVVPSEPVELGQGYVAADHDSETPGRLLPARCVEGAAGPTAPAWAGLRTLYFSGNTVAGGAISPERASRYTLYWQDPVVQEYGRRVRPDARTSASGVSVEVAGQPYALSDPRRLPEAGDCGTHFVVGLQPGRRFEYALVLRWPDAATQQAFAALAGSSDVPALFVSRQLQELRAFARTHGATFSVVVLAHGFDAEALAALHQVLAPTRCSADDFAACEATLQGLWQFQADHATAHPEDLAVFPGFNGTWATVSFGPLPYATLPD